MALKIAGNTVVDDDLKAYVDGVDLSAISASIADTAVDVFVYDTSKDSDGGAWRKRTQHTSWYNETLNTATRGSRKEFPAVAVIVAESNQVTIYDGDDPSLPMWMVFNAHASNILRTSFNCVSGLNGIISMGNLTNLGLHTINLLADTGRLRHPAGDARDVYYKGNIAERNSYKAYNYTITGADGIVHGNVNDVAMTVLPNAPIDPATQLPVPTIAVATGGGVSVIKDDGSVVDIVWSTSYGNYSKTISFTKDHKIAVDSDIYDVSAGRYIRVHDIPSSDSVVNYYYGLAGAERLYRKGSYPHVFGAGGTYGGFNLDFSGENAAFGHFTGYQTGFNGLVQLKENTADYTKGMTSYITSTYNTGWMNGDIKLATLSDTDDTDVTGSELVTNGTFDVDSDWTDSTGDDVISGGTYSYDGNTSTFHFVTQTVPAFVVGKTYTVSVEVVTAGASNFRFPYDGSVDNIKGVPNSVGIHTYTFVAKSSSTTLYMGYTTGTFEIDNVSVRLAEEDRSVNGNGLQVFGTVTKNPVATGADLVAYSGFSPSNYLEQPYNPDLDFGTGDFCVMGWVKNWADSRYIFDRAGDDGSQRIYLYNTGGNIGTNFTPNYISVAPLDQDAWGMLTITRLSGVSYIYINGELKGSGANTYNIDGSSAKSKFKWGLRYNTNNALGQGSLALWRISGTAPTAEQIAKIYESEKHLFTEGAQATLYGSSDAVTALAYDDTTELLHVGTSAGRSDFSGLRRVSNTTDAVGTAISASNGMIVEE